MPYNDFREFLDALRKNGELVDIDRPVDLKSDVGNAMKQSGVRKGPALLFKQNGTAMELVGITAGPVRPPLPNLLPEDAGDLRALIELYTPVL